MRILRRQLGVLVLVVLSGQLGTVAVAALAIGCGASAAAASTDDCCPAGSHADGMCPMRTRSGRAGHSTNDLSDGDCRMVCANQESALLVFLSAAASLPHPPSAPRPQLAAGVETTAPDRLVVRFTVPPSPPPRD